MAANTERKRRPRGSNDCVRVAVRCRPFKDYEIQGRAKLVVGMDPYNDDDISFNTYLETPTGQKKWGFDFSFWSHDELKGPIITQDKLYNIIGLELLDDFMDEYNVCLFAYGQSGSGKTYSMVGVPKIRDQWGIVPRIGEDICKQMKINNANPNRTHTWKLSVTMVEIYREVVRDLLVDNSPEIKVTRGPDPNQKGKDKTIMVGVNPSPVKDWDELFALICSSQERKSVAATGLNDKSSRAHTIFEIILTKTTYPVPTDAKQNHRIENSIRLVDLAGSERLNKSSANAAFNEQTRLEGIAINQSLTTLGAIIKQVGKTSAIANEKERLTKLNSLSWRNSQLTMLLRDALAGNCRTVMIAAVSPADLNWEESKGTLDWAAACKEVKLKSSKIQATLTPLEKTQAELKKVKEELEELKKKAAAGGASGAAADPQASLKIEELQKELAEQAKINEENDRLLAEVKKQREAAETKQKMRLTVPHFALLAQDPGLSRMKEYFTPAGITTVGVAPECGIAITGVKAIDQHATINNTGGNVTITPFEYGFTLINGKLKTGSVTLAHNDRVVFGHSNFFIFQDPRIMATQSEEVKRKDAERFDYTYCLNESHEETVGKVIREAKERQEAEEKERDRERQHKYEMELVEQKKRETELAAEKAELKRHADEQQKEIQKILAAQAEEKKRLESARAADAAQQEILRKQLAELKARQDESKAQAVEMERKYKEQQQQLREREAEEQRRKQSAIKREEQRELNRKRDHQRWESRLRELMPLVNNCNEMCAEMNIDQTFAIVPISDEDDIGAPNTNVFVSVQRGGVSGLSLWDDDIFIDKSSEMKSIWGKWKKTGIIELPQSDRLNPFFDSASDIQPLGRGGLVCEYLYERMPFEDHLSIIDHQGRLNGRLEVKAEVFVDPALERAVDAKEDEEGPPALRLFRGKTIDIGMKIMSAAGLPVAYQQNVYVTYRWPRFLSMEPIAEPIKPKVSVVDENIDGDNDVHTQMTQVQNKQPPFTVNPVFNYNKYFRVLVTDELLDWLKDGQLQLEVFGVHDTAVYREEFLRKIAQKNKAASEVKASAASTPRPAAADGTAAEKKNVLSDELKRAEHVNKTKLAVVRGVLLESKMKLKEKRESTGRVGGAFDRQSSTVAPSAGASMAAAAAAEEQIKLKNALEMAERKALDASTALAAERKAHVDDHKHDEQKLAETEKVLKQREAELVAARKEAEDMKQKLHAAELANQQKSKACVIL